jgi:hypothetical protein
MAATRGVPPGPALHTYVTDDVFRRIEFRAKGHRVRRPDPGYECRTHLTLVNRQVIEASVIVTGHNLTRAIAIRLERRPRGWQAVEFVTA